MIDKTLKKLKKRNIESNIKQFLAVILISFLSTLFLIGFVVNLWTIKGSVEKFYSQTSLPMFWLGVDSISGEDEKFFEKKGYYFDKRLYFETDVNVAELKESYTSKVYVSDGKLSTPFVSTGTRGCFVDQFDVEKLGLEVGFDEIYIKYYVKESDVFVDLKFRIVGTMCFSENSNSGSKELRVFVDEDIFLSEVNRNLSVMGKNRQGTVQYNQILIENEDCSVEDIEEYYKTSSSKLLYVWDRTDFESVLMLETEVSMAKNYIFIFPIAFFVVCIMIVLSTIRGLVLEEQSKIGMLKAMGVTNSKILKFYAGYGSYLCAIGAVCGAAVSSLVVPNIIMSKYAQAYAIPREYMGTQFPWLAAILIVLGVIILGFVVSLVQSLMVLKKNPIECLKPRFDVKVRLKSKGGKLPLSLKMAVRNIKQNFVRTIVALFGISITVALLFIGFGVQSTLDGKIFEVGVLSTSGYMTALKFFAVLLSAIVFANLLIQIMQERTYEIATLKALGINLKKMFLSVAFEIVLLAVGGLLMGIGIGFPLLLAVLKIGNSPFASLTILIDFLSIIWIFLIIFAMVAFAVVFAFVWICKINIIKTIKTNE